MPRLVLDEEPIASPRLILDEDLPVSKMPKLVLDEPSKSAFKFSEIFKPAFKQFAGTMLTPMTLAEGGIGPISKLTDLTLKPEVERTKTVAALVGAPLALGPAGLMFPALKLAESAFAPLLEDYVTGNEIRFKDMPEKMGKSIKQNFKTLLGIGDEEAPSLATAGYKAAKILENPKMLGLALDTEEKKKAYGDIIQGLSYLATAPGMVRKGLSLGKEAIKIGAERAKALPQIAKERGLYSEQQRILKSKIAAKNPTWTPEQVEATANVISGGKIGKVEPAIIETAAKTIEAPKPPEGFVLTKPTLPKPILPSEIVKPPLIAPKVSLPIPSPIKPPIAPVIGYLKGETGNIEPSEQEKKNLRREGIERKALKDVGGWDVPQDLQVTGGTMQDDKHIVYLRNRGDTTMGVGVVLEKGDTPEIITEKYNTARKEYNTAIDKTKENLTGWVSDEKGNLVRKTQNIPSQEEADNNHIAKLIEMAPKYKTAQEFFNAISEDDSDVIKRFGIYNSIEDFYNKATEGTSPTAKGGEIDLVKSLDSMDGKNKFKILSDYVYSKYKEYVDSGKYPYLKQVQEYIEKDNPNLTEEQKTSLHTQIYNASQQFRKEKRSVTIEDLKQKGWNELTSDEPLKQAIKDDNYIKVYYTKSGLLSSGKNEEVFKPFIDNEGKAYLMKPKATTKGIHLNNFTLDTGEISMYKIVDKKGNELTPKGEGKKIKKSTLTSADNVSPEGLKVGDLVKWNGDESGRIDKVTKIVGALGGGYEYYTEETNPPKGQKPKIGKQFYDKTEEYADRKVGIVKVGEGKTKIIPASKSGQEYLSEPDNPLKTDFLSWAKLRLGGDYSGFKLSTYTDGEPYFKHPIGTELSLRDYISARNTMAKLSSKKKLTDSEQKTYDLNIKYFPDLQTTPKEGGGVDIVKAGELGEGIKTNSNVEKLKQEIRSSGKVMPIEITKDNFIVDGEHRYKALLELGVKEIPVFIGEQEGSSGRLKTPYSGLMVDVKLSPKETAKGGEIAYLYRYHPKGDLNNVIRNGLTPYTQQQMQDRAWKSGDAIKWGWDKSGFSPDDPIENTTNDAGDAPRIFFTPEQWPVDKDRVQLRIRKGAIKHDLIADKNLPPDVFIEGEDVGVPPEDIEIKVKDKWIPLNQYNSKLSPKGEVAKPSLITPKVIPAKKALSILPRKEQLLKQIDEAIAKAPDEAKGPSITFETDGGANIINSKGSLQSFKAIIKKQPAEMSLEAPVKKGIRKLPGVSIAEPGEILAGGKIGAPLKEELPTKKQPTGREGFIKVDLLNPARWDNMRQFIEDDWLRVKRLIQQKGANVTDTNNPYEAEIRYWGRLGTRTESADRLITQIDQDIVTTAKKLKISDKVFNKEIDRFLIARHAPERNAKHGDGAAGITTQEARDYLVEISNKPYIKEVERIANRIQDLNNRTLDVLLEGQVITKELYDELRTLYKNHIPLQRVMNEQDDIVEVLTRRGFDVQGAGLKRAKGSELEVADILTNVVANYKSALMRAEKNIVDNYTLRFARENEYFDGLFEEIKAKAIGKTFDGRIILEQIKDPKVLPVREKGNQVYLKINDPQLAMALRGVNRQKVDGLIRLVKGFTRFYAGLMTRFNPEFVVSNKIRDLQEVAVYLASKNEIGFKGTAEAIIKDPRSVKDVTDYIRGKDTGGARLYEQMKMDGGTTGGMGLSTREQLELDINKIRAINRNAPRKVAQTILQSIDSWNTIFEDSSRLSVYRQALKQGVSRNKAAVLAKEASVNFNKMGTGSPVINALYMFSNASVQGTAKMLRAMRNPKVLAAVLTLLGGAVFLINEYNDKKDKDWRKKVSKWDRLNGINIVISTDKGIKYVTIPISWGLKPIKVFFDEAGDLMSGHETSVSKAVSGLLASTIEAYNPAGGTDIVSAITPTILDLPVDIARNRSWTGGKIRPDWNNSAPASIQYFDNLRKDVIGKGFIKVTKEWGERGIEISPADVNYAYEQLIGGTGRFVDKALNTIVGTAQGKAQAKEIPFVSRFYRDIPEEQIREFGKDYDEVKKRLIQQDKDRFYFSQEAELVYAGLKNLPARNANANLKNMYETNKKLYDKVVDIKREDDLKLSYTDRLISKLGIENGQRAKYIWKKVNELQTAKEKNTYLRNLYDKKIITDEVFDQISYLKSRK